VKSQEGERVREERVSQRKSVGRKKIHVSECKGSLKGLGFSHVCVSGRSESRRAKAAGAEPSGEMSGQKVQTECQKIHEDTQNRMPGRQLKE
jgi:hypothetical protein